MIDRHMIPGEAEAMTGMARSLIADMQREAEILHAAGGSVKMGERLAVSATHLRKRLVRHVTTRERRAAKADIEIMARFIAALERMTDKDIT
ncbi:hypothetical protein DWU98_19350 [Dyella monticola]|uniref:Uncharacterized protein n=1 Tax=Dyella monticola TaxID=1927958 RepID=A0A370WSQ5_9GAMM|nr:hypothetical protein [Dyella monticola]RDS79162.1 hypothetical protein DWU98_19350 [Dyella monticola]